MTSSTSLTSPTNWPESRPLVAGARFAIEPARLNAHKVLDLRESTNHPLSLRYSEMFSQCVVWGRFEHGRAQPGLDAGRSTPFFKAARAALEHGPDCADVSDVMLRTLHPYYECVRPAHAAEWLGLEGDDAPQALAAAPPWAAVFPWRARSIESYRQAYEEAALAENSTVGREVGIEDGWLFCGPVSDEKIRIEAERILIVIRRILEHGYQRSDENDGDVRATALVNEAGHWRWLITAGNHRASAAAAIGLPAIPIRVNLVISRADVRHWCHVADGLIGVPQALAIFDRYFNACPPPVAQSWLALSHGSS